MSLNAISSQTQFDPVPQTTIFKFKEIYNKEAAINEANKLKEEAFGKLDKIKTKTTKLIKGLIKKNNEAESDDIDISYEGCFLKSYWSILAERCTEYEFDRDEIITISNSDATAIRIIQSEDNTNVYTVEHGKIILRVTEDCVRENIVSQIFDNENGQVDENFHQFIKKFKPKKYDFSIDTDRLIKPALSKIDLIQKINTKLLTEIKSSRIIQDRIQYNKIELYLLPIHIFKCYKKSTQETAYIKINSINGERLKNDNTVEVLSNDKFREVVIDIAAEAANSFLPGSGAIVKLAAR